MFNFNDKKPFHSSGYAEVAHGGSIGATSSQSFQERSQIDNNRQVIGKYHESAVARNLKSRASGYDAGRRATPSKRYVLVAERRRMPGGQSASPAAPRERFSEPQGRTYNPFA